MGLRAEVEHVRPVGRLAELANEVVDRRAIGEVGEVDLQPFAKVPDVVERAARVRAHEGMDGGSQVDEGVRQVRAHEAVGSGDENGAALIDVAELTAKVVE